MGLNIRNLFKGKNRIAPNIYSSPLVSGSVRDYAGDTAKAAIACIAHEIMKTVPAHVITTDGNDIAVSSDIQNVLERPNKHMTKAQFLEKVTWLLYLNSNAFIIPTYNQIGELDGLYPVKPSKVEIIQDDSGSLFYKFTFSNGYEPTIEQSSVIHLKLDYSEHEILGGNKHGKPDTRTLEKLENVEGEIIESLSKAIKASYSITGIVKYNTVLDKETTKNNIKKLEQDLKKGESGLLPLDLKSEYIPMQRDLQLIDTETMKFLDQKILRFFGVSTVIIDGKFSPEEHAAFYQRAVEHVLIGMSQEFTKKLFTDSEQFLGNKIIFYPNELYFWNNAEKLEAFNMLIDTGALYVNELRTGLGLKPLPEFNQIKAESSQKQFATNRVMEIEKEKNDNKTDNRHPDSGSKTTEAAGSTKTGNKAA